jgi:hypothetical protein
MKMHLNGPEIRVIDDDLLTKAIQSQRLSTKKEVDQGDQVVVEKHEEQVTMCTHI